MKTIAKTIASLTMAGIIASTNVVSYANDTTEISEIGFTLSIDECANNIKTIYIERYPEAETVINEIVDTIVNDTQFVVFFEQEGATAFQIVEDSLCDVLIPTASASSLYKGVYSSRYPLPIITQKEKWYCGPASVQMALIGNGVLHNNTQDKSDSKQEDIASCLNTNTGGTNITEISAYMREQFPEANGYEYKAKAFTCYTYQNAIEMVKISLQQNAVAIIRVDDTSVLDYYNGEQFTHYMCISEVDTIEDTVKLVDPHYDSVYRGYHEISISEFEELVNYNGWIVLYTSAKDGYYVYD